MAIKSREMSQVGHTAYTADIRNRYKTLVGKREGKRPLGSPRRRWYGNNLLKYMRNEILGCQLD
jgi:hypothetical protein